MASIPTGLLFVLFLFGLILIIYVLWTNSVGDIARGFGLYSTPIVSPLYVAQAKISGIKITSGGSEITNEILEKDNSVMPFVVEFDLTLSKSASVICDSGWTVSGQMCTKEGEKPVVGYRDLKVIFEVPGSEPCSVEVNHMTPGEVRTISSAGCTRESGSGLELQKDYSGQISVKISVNDAHKENVILATNFGGFFVYLKVSSGSELCEMLVKSTSKKSFYLINNDGNIKLSYEDLVVVKWLKINDVRCSNFGYSSDCTGYFAVAIMTAFTVCPTTGGTYNEVTLSGGSRFMAFTKSSGLTVICTLTDAARCGYY